MMIRKRLLGYVLDLFLSITIPIILSILTFIIAAIIALLFLPFVARRRSHRIKTLYSTGTLNTIMSKRASITNLEVLFLLLIDNFVWLKEINENVVENPQANSMKITFKFFGDLS
ncbi:hypothetical protein ABE67_18580 [Cytobacillus firmus]|uniref:hypothetical protein n=1 Tax=Cytobacillus firmus TaxID=1399 RepID=UPI0018CE63DC|nr:hypothetical protein [Cytobacillus firmus]MBG9447389.1 hypothetical protein [Cytobacillus firmus]MBG9451243.1 hypothetical protein [Cytobacillus firmus]